MTFQSEWAPLNQRPDDIKSKVDEIYRRYADKDIFKEAIDLYLNQEWGSLEQSTLYRGLLECRRREIY